MKLFSPISVVTLLFIIVTVLCAPNGVRYTCGLSDRYAGRGLSGIEKDSLLHLLAGQCRLLGDTLSPDSLAFLWDLFDRNKNTSSQTAAVQNISTFAALLSGRGYSVITLQPATYESICALSKLPVLVWFVVIHYPDNKPSLISDRKLSMLQTQRLASHADAIRLHCITAIEKSVNTYEILSKDGMVFQGIPRDTLQGQIVPESPKNSSRYAQIIECLCISILPEYEIERHLDDWYGTIPQPFTKPEIRRIR